MKTVLISGGSRGLGRDLALYLAACGNYSVTTFARNEAANHQQLGLPLVHLPKTDICKEESLAKLAPYLSQADTLVNNVGVAYDGLLATQGEQSIREMLEVNLVSVLILTKRYLRQRMAVGKQGNVVTISSIISKRGFSGLATYSASKGALNSMTQALAREMGPKGFRINAVLPGYFESDLSRGLGDKQLQQIIRRTPLGRLATTADICPVVEFLLSERSAFITGQLFTIDGGLTV